MGVSAQFSKFSETWLHHAWKLEGEAAPKAAKQLGTEMSDF